jgi:hypothetical protein
MIDRCHNEKHRYYADYGGRGIMVYKGWRDNFQNFLADMGEAPKGFSIERIDNSIGYYPFNCKWATHQEQQNNKRDSRFVSVNGKTMTITQWANESGVGVTTIRFRLDNGWGEKDAIFTKPRKLNARRRENALVF